MCTQTILISTDVSQIDGTGTIHSHCIWIKIWDRDPHCVKCHLLDQDLGSVSVTVPMVLKLLAASNKDH